MADVTADRDDEHAASLRRRYLIRFGNDTQQERPLWIRLIIEFADTLVLVTPGTKEGGHHDPLRPRARGFVMLPVPVHAQHREAWRRPRRAAAVPGTGRPPVPGAGDDDG